MQCNMSLVTHVRPYNVLIDKLSILFVFHLITTLNEIINIIGFCFESINEIIEINKRFISKRNQNFQIILQAIVKPSIHPFDQLVIHLSIHPSIAP